jgi:hypothetical protein
MPMKTKYRRKSRKPRKTTRRKYMPKGKRGTFRSKVKKALMSMSETKSVGRVMDEHITLGNTSASWLLGQYILPVNNTSDMLIQQGTAANERIGNRIEFKSIRIPMYITNQTPETLRMRVMVVKQKTNLPAHPHENHLFVDPLGRAEQFNHVAPWQADWPCNKEIAHVVKQRTFYVNGSIDWGAQTTGFPGHSSYNAPKQSKPVEGRARVLGAEEWVPYASSNEAARSLGLDRGSVSACCSGKQKQTCGYEFRWGVPNEAAVLEGEVWVDIV